MNDQNQQNIYIRDIADIILKGEANEFVDTSSVLRRCAARQDSEEKNNRDLYSDSKLSGAQENFVSIQMNSLKNDNDKNVYKSRDAAEFNFLKSLTSQEIDHLLKIFVEVAEKEESRMKKINRKLLKEVLYFKNEVDRTLSENESKCLDENKFCYDSLNFGLTEELHADQDIMFHDNLHIYNSLLQKRQPVLHQYIGKITQPNQLCQLLQDLKGIKESIDVARSLVILTFIELNKKAGSFISRKNSKRTGISPNFEPKMIDENWLRTYASKCIKYSEKPEDGKNILNATTTLAEMSQNFVGRKPSENWLTSESMDLSSEKMGPPFNVLWTPKFHSNRSNVEIEKGVDYAGRNYYRKHKSNENATSLKVDKIEDDLKTLVNQFYKIFLQSEYFENPGFVATVGDANDLKRDAPTNLTHINSSPQMFHFNDASKNLPLVHNKDSSLKFEVSSGNHFNGQSVSQIKTDKQSKPTQILQPMQYQQHSTTQYSHASLLSSIARLSLENFLRSGSFPSPPKSSVLTHKLKLKPRISNHSKIPQEFVANRQLETMNITPRTLRSNLLRAHDPLTPLKMIDNNHTLLRGIDLWKHCSKPCKLLLVNQCTSISELSPSEASSPLFISSSLRWVVKWIEKLSNIRYKKMSTIDTIPAPPPSFQILPPQNFVYPFREDKRQAKTTSCYRNHPHFKMVEIEIRDLTETIQPNDNSGTQSVIMKPLSPSDIYPAVSNQSGNMFVIPSHHSTYHPPSHASYHSSRPGKIPLKQQRRRHIFRNI